MGDDLSPETEIALLKLRVTRLEDDRKWLMGAAVSALAWIATQVLPHIPMLLKGVGK